MKKQLYLTITFFLLTLQVFSIDKIYDIINLPSDETRSVFLFKEWLIYIKIDYSDEKYIKIHSSKYRAPQDKKTSRNWEQWILTNQKSPISKNIITLPKNAIGIIEHKDLVPSLLQKILFTKLKKKSGLTDLGEIKTNWNPTTYFDGDACMTTSHDIFYIIWPKDNSALSNSTVTLYIPAREHNCLIPTLIVISSDKMSISIRNLFVSSIKHDSDIH